MKFSKKTLLAMKPEWKDEVHEWALESEPALLYFAQEQKNAGRAGAFLEGMLFAAWMLRDKAQ